MRHSIPSGGAAAALSDGLKHAVFAEIIFLLAAFCVPFGDDLNGSVHVLVHCEFYFNFFVE